MKIYQGYVIFGLLFVMIMSILGAFPASLGQEKAKSAEIYNKSSSPYGVPYNEWPIKWWQWQVTIPTSKHPLTNETQTTCPSASDGNVTFVAHKFADSSSITCTVPSDKAILLSLISAECDTAETGSNDEMGLKVCASKGNDYGKMQLIVDGEEVGGLDANRIQTRFFNITFPKDTFYGSPAGTFKSIVDGYFALLKPLSIGNHNIHIIASVDNPTDKQYNFAYDAKILLTVK
jgi:hypothetical protein